MLGRDEKSGKPLFLDRFDIPISVEGVTAFDPPTWGKNGFVDTVVRAFAGAGIGVGGSTFDEHPGILLPAIFIGRKPEPFRELSGYATSPAYDEVRKNHPPPWDPGTPAK
jgi:hypothetical protein